MEIDIPTRVEVVQTGATTYELMINGVRFPYGTRLGSVKCTPLPSTNRYKWVTVSFLVDGDVIIPDSYIQD